MKLRACHSIKYKLQVAQAWFMATGFVLYANPAGAKDNSAYHYAGVEFYGSSQITRLELEKYLGLKSGASLGSVDLAVQRLSKKLDERHLGSSVKVISAPPDKVYVAVDISDSTTAATTPIRRLRYPGHIQVNSEKPFVLLSNIETRLEKLSDEGRTWSEVLKDGVKYYTDEPCNELVDQLLKQVPNMQEELLAVVDSDTDPNRRRQAVELLQWTPNATLVCARLIPALDDADADVRTTVARYMFSRLELLPEDFPYSTLVESFSRQLHRASHQDRTKSLFCLLALCGQHPQLIDSIKALNEERVKQLAANSVIPSIKEPADKLAHLFAQTPSAPPPPVAPGSGFDL